MWFISSTPPGPCRSPHFTAALTPGAPPKGVFGGDWTPQRKSSPGQQLQSTSHCLGRLRGPLWWSPCLRQRNSEPLPTPAGSRQSKLGASQFTRCQMQGLFAGSPAYCVMPDILHVCYTGISVSHLSQSEGHRVFLNKAGDHLAPCSQNYFFIYK